MMGGPALPGVGFGIGTERILMELSNQGIVVEEPSVTDVFVAQITAEDKADAFSMMQKLRNEGIKAECDHVGRSLKAQFKYANKINARFIVMVGGDEGLRGMVRMRNLTTREESEMTSGDAIIYIRNNGEAGK